MKLLKVSEKALKKYREQVKGNQNITYEQASRKLTRNIILVKETAPDNIKRKWFTTTYHYGNLDISVKFGTVIDIENHKNYQEHPSYWEFPKERYMQLNKELGIKENKFKKKKKR